MKLFQSREEPWIQIMTNPASGSIASCSLLGFHPAVHQNFARLPDSGFGATKQPEGEDEGKVFPASPFLAQVENEGPIALGGDSEIADHEDGVGIDGIGLEGRWDAGFLHDSGPVAFFEEDPGEGDGGGAGVVQGQGFHILGGFPAEEADRGNLAIAGDPEMVQGQESRASEGFDGGDQGPLEFSGAETPNELGRDLLPQLHSRMGVETLQKGGSHLVGDRSKDERRSGPKRRCCGLLDQSRGSVC